MESPAPVQVHNNEPIIWRFLLSNGFTRNQAAGIMGNLRQEHGYNTSDAGAAGLGMAQWLGNRRAALESKGNHLDLTTQLNFMLEEFNTTERQAGNAVRAAQTIEEATIAFQNLYERCGNCKQAQRVGYARDILARY